VSGVSPFCTLHLLACVTTGRSASHVPGLVAEQSILFLFPDSRTYGTFPSVRSSSPVRPLVSESSLLLGSLPHFLTRQEIPADGSFLPLTLQTYKHGKLPLFPPPVLPFSYPSTQATMPRGSHVSRSFSLFPLRQDEYCGYYVSISPLVTALRCQKSTSRGPHRFPSFSFQRRAAPQSRPSPRLLFTNQVLSAIFLLNTVS